jgi:phage terminase large subunit GpA-like protein
MSKELFLSPCPHCGERERLTCKSEQNVRGSKGWPMAIHCERCGSRGPVVWSTELRPPEASALWNGRLI